MSSQLQVTGEAKIRDIQGPVVANSGVITALDGAASQYVRGDGTLADFPTSTGGGSSVSYYLNSSVSQGTIGGVAYRQLGKTPIIGAGTDITISANGYVASYITDANDPALLEVPAGNFNCEFYFSVNSNNHNPYVYAEVYKYDGSTFTLIGTSNGVPEYLSNGTTLSPYYFAIPVSQTVLAITDRIAIRIYVNVDGRVVTLHTENGHLCQVVTTFSKGLTSLNNLTRQVQFLATGTSGTDFGISSSVATHTFNLPVASATNTGKLSSSDWSTFNAKEPAITAGTTLQYYRGDKTFQTLDTTAVVEATNLYFTDARARAALSFAAGSGAYNSTTGVITIPTNTNQLTNGASFITLTSLSAGTGISYNNTTGVITNSAPDQTVSLTAGAGISITGTYPSFTIASTITQYTDALARAAISLTTTGSSGAATYNSTTGVFNIPNYGSALSAYLPLAGGIMTGQIVLKEGTTSTDYTKGLRFPNDPYGGSGDVAGMRLYPSSGENMVLELYTGNDGPQDAINFATGVGGTANNDSVTINGNRIWNAGNLTPQTQLNGTGFVKASGTTISYDNSTYLTTSAATSTYVPYTGANANVALGSYSLSLTNLSVNNILANNNGTNDIGTSGGNTFRNVYANSFVKTGGTSSQFLKADGSVDSTSYFSTSGGIVSGNIYMQSSANPSQLLAKGVNTEFWVDSQYGGGTARAFINRNGVGNQATLMFSTGVVVTNGTAWAGVCDYSMGMTNDGTGNFYIGAGDLFSSGNRALTITSSRNVGIGTSSPLGSAIERTLHLSDGGGGYATVYVTNSANSVRSVFGMQSSQNLGIVGTQTNTPFAIYTNDTERMRITSGGNVGIGTSSPASRLSVQWDKSTAFSGFGIYDSQAYNASNHGGTVTFGGIFNSSGSYTEWSGIGGMKSNTTDGNVSGDINFYTRLDGSGMTERMRITSGGQVTISSSLANNFILSVTNSSSTSGEGIISNLNSSSSTLTYFAGYSTSDSAYKFLARTNGDVRNATGVYGTISSDRRLKENIVSATPKLDDIMKLNVVNFNLIGNQEKQIGFIAQEMQEVFPSLVDQTDTRQYDEDGNVISGLEDAFGVKVGMEFAILVKAIQELKAEIEELKELIKNK